MPLPTDRPSRTAAIAGGAALALSVLTVANAVAARRAEARHPPRGRMISAGGVRLHAMRFGPRGSGAAPVVLLHGNVVTSGDWLASGVAGRLAAEREVVVFDRPGFGHSEPPRGTAQDPQAQAALLAEACHRLGIVRPIVVGHSWATLVALAWALDRPQDTAGIVLLGGYYYPTARLDVALVAPAAVPVLGDVLRYTVSPPLTRIALPVALKGMFAPRPVPAGYGHAVPPGLICRPGQLGAVAKEGATMPRRAAALSRRADRLRLPVAIMAGRADQVVDCVDQSVRFADDLSRRSGAAVDLWVERGAGHMVHHAAPGRVVELISRIDRTPVR